MRIERIIKLKDDETVLATVRQMPLAFVGPLALSLLLLAAPFFFMIPLFRLGKFGILVFVLSIVAGALWGLQAAVRWHYTVLIVTSHRLVDVDQRGLFDRFVSESPFEKVQDISYARKGFWGTVLNFGTLVIQTAGANAHLEQNHVRSPQDIQHLIVEAMSARRAGPDGSRNGKFSDLLEAAAGLSSLEAKAFLTELQAAVSREDGESVVSEGEIESFVAGNFRDGTE